MKKIIAILVLSFVLISCFKEEQIIKLPPTQSDMQLGIAELTEDYKNQVFYDLKTNKSVKTVELYSWDLGFNCSDTVWSIVLNTGKLMLAGKTGSSDFNSVTTPSGLDMHFDASSYNADSMAIGDLSTTSNIVYVIDLGKENPNSKVKKYKKIIFNKTATDEYYIKYADLNGEHEKTAYIKKNPTKNYVYLSFENGAIDFEPEKDKWTLLFTSYETTLLAGTEPYPYLVRGVLLNPNKVGAVMDTVNIFEKININDSTKYNFSYRRDIIGHDWKFYSFASSSYTITKKDRYIIRTGENYFYKLKFIGFYNDKNEKGYPTFQYSRL